MIKPKLEFGEKYTALIVAGLEICVTRLKPTRPDDTRMQYRVSSEQGSELMCRNKLKTFLIDLVDLAADV